MSGASIAAEVADALVSLADELGTGSFAITLTRPGAQATPWATAGTDTQYDLTGLVQDYPQSMIDGTLIRSGDRRVMVAATGEKPLTTDRLSICGNDYQIISIGEKDPQGVALYYEVQVRA